MSWAGIAIKEGCRHSRLRQVRNAGRVILVVTRDEWMGRGLRGTFGHVNFVCVEKRVCFRPSLRLERSRLLWYPSPYSQRIAPLNPIPNPLCCRIWSSGLI